MKLVHLSDLHLGFRQYQRQTQFGLNQREADVANAFRKAIDRIIEVKPDLIVVGGDVFHAVRPTNPAILHAFAQFSRLVEALPDAVIVMIAGNHDTPRTSETGWILRLFATLGITIVEDAAKSIRFRDGELSVLAVPSSVHPLPELKPDTSARYNVLLLHRQVEGIINRFGARERPEISLRLSDIRPGWDYVALGHYHVYEKVADNAWYSGAIEYTTTNIWGEIDEESKKPPNKRGKGIIEHDLDTGAHEFHRLALARRVIDIPQIEAVGMTPAEISEAICAAVDNCEGGIDDRIVRLIVRDVPRHILRDLDHRKIREFKRRALNFLLDARRPDPVRILMASGAPGRRASLAETVQTMLETRDVTPGIDRKSLVSLGLHYLNEADRLAPAITGDEG
ncbi:MAG: DNA repair exonuclease [Gemmatimonadales bacterium]